MSIDEEREGVLVKQGAALVLKSTQFQDITTDGTRDQALVFGKSLAEARDVVKALFDEPVRQAHALHKTLCGRRKGLDDPLRQAQETVETSVGRYERLKREAVQAERRREVEEREAAEAEHRKEVARIEKRNERCVSQKELPAEPVYVAPVVPVYVAPAGTTTTVNWKFRIVDASKIPTQFLTPDLVAIGAYVRKNKGAAKITGVEVFDEAKVR